MMRRRLGIALIVVGLSTILGAVLYVVEVANGPGTGPTAFAERRSYDQVKESVHGTFPVALLFGLAGLGLAIGGRALSRR